MLYYQSVIVVQYVAELTFVCRPSRRILLQERCDFEDGGAMQVE
jgi:hypothetical protein